MLRPARVSDVPAMHALINRFAGAGLMLPCPRSKLYDCLRDFVVKELDGKVAGTGALRVVWEDLGEVRSLCVEEPHQRRGFGTELVEQLLSAAVLLDLKRVFVLTYVPEFFRRFGFKEVDKRDLPHKIWADCIECPKFPDCDEVALVKRLE